MKSLGVLVLLFLFSAVFCSAAQAQTFYGTTDLKTFREGREKEFRNKNESPLREKDFADFKGLKYFPYNRELRFKAVMTKAAEEKYFWMPTSVGKSERFVQFGTATFKLNGKKYSLIVFQLEKQLREKYPEYKDLLFVPFKDLTNGKETYSVGRYIDVKISTTNEIILDFNLAYNPNCAYGSDKYSCPIPPKKNRLPIKISAGEKVYLTAEEQK